MLIGELILYIVILI